MLYQRSGESDALLLAAGQLMRVSSLETFEADEPQHVLDTRSPLAPAQATQAERDVLLHAQVGEQGILLEDHADVSVFGRCHIIGGRYELSRQKDLPCPDRFESGDGAEDGGFSAS